MPVTGGYLTTRKILSSLSVPRARTGKGTIRPANGGDASGRARRLLRELTRDAEIRTGGFRRKGMDARPRSTITMTPLDLLALRDNPASSFVYG